MWWDGKTTRTLRCRLTQQAGSLGHRLAAVGEAGFTPSGDIVPNPLDKELDRTVAGTAIRQRLNRDDLVGDFD